jgi:DNA/RNA endonuclease YhcR with UshA esterase domain
MHLLTKILSAAGISLLLAFSVQADSIRPQEAYHHAGDVMTVEGIVSQVSTSSGGTTFINFGGRYPNHVFYAVIFRNSSDQFSGVQALAGRAVAISGKVELYKGKPQIILLSPNQIELLK